MEHDCYVSIQFNFWRLLERVILDITVAGFHRQQAVVRIWISCRAIRQIIRTDSVKLAEVGWNCVVLSVLPWVVCSFSRPWFPPTSGKDSNNKDLGP